MINSRNIRNIGIVAHVDAGKTTLTEQLLFKGGTIRNPGSVDKGTAHTDFLEVERERGISVKAAEATLIYKDVEIHLIDTPGHIDFSAEVERSLRVLDGAVVVISAVEGVQPQTEVYFKALKTLNIPVLFFINKIDRVGSDTERVLKEIKELLTGGAFAMQKADISDDKIMLSQVLDSGNGGLDSVIEFVAERDEKIFERYLEGQHIPEEEILNSIRMLVKSCDFYPVYFGSALRGVGIEQLLEGIIDFLPCPEEYSDGELSGVVYKIAKDKTFGKMVYVRLYSGKLKTREEVYNYTKDIREKITQIKKVSGTKIIDSGEALGGEFACIAGLNSAAIGDVFGSPVRIPGVTNLANPLLTLQVHPKEEKDLMNLVEAMRELEEEDPLLRVQWIKEKREIHIQIMGTIQLEVLQSILKERFNLEVTFGKPSVIYKETILKEGYGFDAYTMPKPCWAILKFKLEPLPPGSGLMYESIVRTEKIKLRYQREVEKRVPEALKQGLYGWEVIDIKITLVEGEDHIFHTHPGDFIVATPMALMDGLRSIGTTLLEPLIKFRISVPEECSGKVIGDIIAMRGEFDTPVINNGIFTIEGVLPVSTSLDYSVKLAMISSGRGTITTTFSGYRPCSLEEGAVRERVGVNPLDRAKYILSIRSALQD